MQWHGERTIQVIDEADGWGFRVAKGEYSVKETFYHTIQAIFEDAGNWFLKDSTPFSPLSSPKKNLNRAINRMIKAIQNFSDEKLCEEMMFQWGVKTTIEGAIQQNLFHAIGHFSQLRNWIGLLQRIQKKQPRKTYL